MASIQGPALFLAQYMADDAPFNSTPFSIGAVIWITSGCKSPLGILAASTSDWLLNHSSTVTIGVAESNRED